MTAGMAYMAITTRNKDEIGIIIRIQLPSGDEEVVGVHAAAPTIDDELPLYSMMISNMPSHGKHIINADVITLLGAPTIDIMTRAFEEVKKWMVEFDHVPNIVEVKDLSDSATNPGGGLN